MWVHVSLNMFIYENHNILVCITGQYTAFAKYTVKHHIQEDHEHCKCLHQKKKKKKKICSETFSKMSGKLVKVYLWGQDFSKDLDHLWVLINQSHWLSVRSRCQRFRAGQWLDVKVCVCVCMCVCACAHIFMSHRHSTSLSLHYQLV